MTLNRTLAIILGIVLALSLAANFFIMPECKIDGSLRLEFFFQKIFSCFKQTEDSAFIIQRSAPMNEAACSGGELVIIATGAGAERMRANCPRQRYRRSHRGSCTAEEILRHS
jgi:hypothetical protein